MGKWNSAHLPLSERAQEICHEQRRRWVAGERVSIEELLSGCPDLSADDPIVLDLVYTEIYLRVQTGERPKIEEYQSRFPQLRSKLGPLFDACQSMAELERERAAATTVPAAGSSMESTAAWDRIDVAGVLLQYDQAYRDGAPPQIDACKELRTADALTRLRLLHELVLLDLEHRWRNAHRQAVTVGPGDSRDAKPSDPAAGPLVEDYVRSYPHLGPLPRPDVEVTIQEFRARWRHGDRPQPDEYRMRFPDHGPKLCELLGRIRDIFAWPSIEQPQVLYETEANGTIASHETSRDEAGEQSERDDPPLARGSAGLAYDPEAPLPYGDFRLGEQIGAGGMGTVFRALQISLNRPVAVKILTKLPRGHSRAVQRFLREARSMAQMRHPNIVDIHGIGRTPDGGYFMAMDLVDGQDLHKLIDSRSVGISDVLRVATIAETVHHAHQRGVIHRDLKPSNILVAPEGSVLVSDFGLAKLLDGEDSELSLPSEPLGTPSYMAPEQASRRWGEVSPRTDVYGLGGILYALLTFQPPFTGQTHWEVLAQVVSEDAPVPPSRLRPDIPGALEAICLKCLAKDPGQRYESAKEVAEALRTWCISANIGPFQDENTVALPASSARAEIPSPKSPSIGSSPPLGAIPLDSEFYLVRGADFEFESALARHDSIVLIRGARQMGKTSLLARGLMQARELGLTVVLIDFQKLHSTDMQTPERLFCTIGEWIADELELDVYPEDRWDSRRSASVNFERYVRREVLKDISTGLIWGLDEVDRLFECPFRSEVFGLFRSWHNARALQPKVPWARLTLAMAYATEAHLFITDPNQSPFNVGTLIAMEDFTPEQITVLNDRYGSPLADPSQIERFYGIVGGQPYLVNRGLYELVSRSITISEFETRADQEMGFFGDHLRHMMSLLNQEPQLREVFAAVLAGNPCPSVESFYRLRSAGFLSGDYAASAQPRCQLYATYFKRHLS